ncbi:MBL fold metallo-hydrolase [Undibacterium terreum]|uniref:MBL fold metallo-hydrolase n=1 Tax=Undibacterium terreum TaxID=1224302 RepID=A0A916XDV5_9BURK|nr:MBL fold metallo-hydrolase [Undibacterium terreum]GGC66712.1 MBL fold metallo-hydrolase [Undibacterium terreum]
MPISSKTSSILGLFALCLTVLASAIAMGATVNPASAGAVAKPVPVSKAGPSGYFRTQVGSFEIIALADGVGAVGAALLHGDQAMIASMLKDDYLEPAMIATPVNAYLINTGSKLILVDTGTGHNWGPPNLGHVMENLRAAGYQASQVDLVLITHLHADHAGGLVSPAGKALFPNAIVRMAQADSDFWLSKKIADAAPESARTFFDVARKSAAPYIKSGHWKPFREGEAIADGVTVVPLPGHTPGHVGYQFSSGGQQVLVWGDVVHAQSVQMAHPEITIDFDGDGSAAAASRAKLFTDLAANGALVAGAHMPFPGLGRLRTSGAAYRWVPTPYAAGGQ